MASMEKKTKRKCLSLETKVMLIEEVDRKRKSKAQICRDHDIASSTLHTILKGNLVIHCSMFEKCVFELSRVITRSIKRGGESRERKGVKVGEVSVCLYRSTLA